MELLRAGRLLLLDLASTLVFLVVVLATGNAARGVVAGMVFGLAQIGWELVRRRPIGAMQWTSLALVLGFGAVSLITKDPRFVTVKPSLIYLVVGAVMLKPGWMKRYLPPAALELVPDLAVVFGFVWAGLMLFSAGLNLIVALTVSVTAWASFMSIYGVISKLGLFLVQYAVMRTVAVRRRRSVVVA